MSQEPGKTAPLRPGLPGTVGKVLMLRAWREGHSAAGFAGTVWQALLLDIQGWAKRGLETPALGEWREREERACLQPQAMVLKGAGGWGVV